MNKSEYFIYKFECFMDTICQWSVIFTVPLAIYGFIGVTSEYEKMSKLPTKDEQIAASIKKYKQQAEEKLKKQQTVKEKGIIPPPQLYNPDDNDFNIPLEQLLEGNHGRFL